MQFFLFALALVAIVSGRQFSCNCSDGVINYRWKNFQDPKNAGYVLGIYVLPKNSYYVPRCSNSNWPMSCHSIIHSFQILDADGMRSIAPTSKPTMNDYQAVYCVLTSQSKYSSYPSVQGSPLLTTCSSGYVPPPPVTIETRDGSPTIRVVFFSLAAVIGFLLLLVSTIRIVRYMKNKNQQTPYSSNVIESTDGGGAIELDQMNGPAYTTVQMFPNHPMMMQTQQQVYQDPLATLAPVYTATYVQPGIH